MGFLAVLCVILAAIVALTGGPLLFTVLQWLVAGLVFAFLAGTDPWVVPGVRRRQ